MKFGRHLIAAAVAVTSTSALAGSDIGLHTIHELTDAKLKATFIDDEGKTKTQNIKKGDLGSLLCDGRELDNKEKLALYAPCPAIGVATSETVYIGVYNRDTGANAIGCNIEEVGLSHPQVEFKENAITRITGLFETDIRAEIGADDVDVEISGALDATTKFVKKSKFPDLPLEETNCFNKVKTTSVSGNIEENREDDAVITSGKLKAGKVKDTISGTEIENGLD